MSVSIIVLCVLVAVVLLMGIGLGVLFFLKRSGKPRMSRWERTAVDRKVSTHLQKLAEDAACAKVVEAMGYERLEVEAE